MNAIVDVRASILINCEKATIVRRITERRCKESRIDDSSETLERRLTIFKEETLPVIEELSKMSNLITIDGDINNPLLIHNKLIKSLNYLIYLTISVCISI